MENNIKLLLGYYGAGNFGDEIILKQYLKENRDTNFIVSSYGETYTKDNVVDTYFWKQGDKLSNLRNFISAIKKVDEVLWVGGTCFTDEDGDGAFKFMLLAKFFFKKIKYINIGVNDLRNKCRIKKTKLILSLADYISVRDIQSYNMTKLYKYKFINRNNLSEIIEQDLGKKYLESLKCNKTNENNLLIAWRVLDRYVEDEKALADKLVKYIKSRVNKYDKIYIIDTDPSKDKNISQKIYFQLNENKNVKYLEDITVDEKINYIGKSSQIITARLHIGICGSLLAKKTYVYNYSNKIKYYAENNHDFYIFNDLNEIKL